MKIVFGYTSLSDSRLSLLRVTVSKLHMVIISCINWAVFTIKFASTMLHNRSLDFSLLILLLIFCISVIIFSLLALISGSAY